MSVRSSKDSIFRNEENKKYLMSTVNDILEPLMLEVVKSQPDNKVSPFSLFYTCLQIKFILKYLEESYGDRATQGDKSMLDFFRGES